MTDARERLITDAQNAQTFSDIYADYHAMRKRLAAYESLPWDDVTAAIQTTIDYEVMRMGDWPRVARLRALLARIKEVRP